MLLVMLQLRVQLNRFVTSPYHFVDFDINQNFSSYIFECVLLTVQRFLVLFLGKVMGASYARSGCGVYAQFQFNKVIG